MAPLDDAGVAWGSCCMMVPAMTSDEELSDLERRAAPRAGIAAQVIIQGEAGWAGVYQTADLSTTGAFLVSDSPPPRGSMVRLDLEVTPEITLRGVQALVVHVRAEASDPSARGCGVMFLRLGREEAETLGSLVDASLGDVP